MGCCSSKNKDEPLLKNDKESTSGSTNGIKPKPKISFIEAKTVVHTPPPKAISYEPPKVNESSVSRLSLPFAPAQKEITSFVNTSNFTHPVKVNDCLCNLRWVILFLIIIVCVFVCVCVRHSVWFLKETRACSETI